MNRRHFLGHALIAPAVGLRAAPTAEARRVRLSCNLYSFNAPLRAGEMSLPEVVAFCAEAGFDAVDPTGYYFPGYPSVPDEAFSHALKRQAFLLGLDLSGTGIRNDFTQPDPAARAADVARVQAWVEAAARLGAPCLRVFSGGETPEGVSRAVAEGWVVEALRACAEHGARRGVMIVLQNHHDFIRTAEETARILDAVGSDWLGLNLDIGSYRAADPYAEIARMAPRAVTWQLKEHVYVGGRETPTDLDRMARIIRGVGYRGYVPLETLGPGDPRRKVPAFLAEVRAAFERAG